MYAIYSKHGYLLGRCDTFMEASWRLKEWSQAAFVVSAGWVAAVKQENGGVEVGEQQLDRMAANAEDELSNFGTY